MDRCPRCGTPQPFRFVRKVLAVAGPTAGLTAVTLAFVLCARALGSSGEATPARVESRFSVYDEYTPEDADWDYARTSRTPAKITQ
jgi:hypothetical protein